MTSYRVGADFERRVRRHLESQGWVVFRAAGSRTPLDLQMGEVALLQCRVDGRLRPAEGESLILPGKEMGCQVALVSREGRALEWGKLYPIEGEASNGNRE